MRILIENAEVIDGSGAPARPGNVVIEDDVIAEVGDTEGPADETLDATGLCLAPGFIDMHSHGDFTLPGEGDAAAKVLQGITTEVVCNCGLGLFPGNERVDAMYEQIAPVIFGEPSAGSSASLNVYRKRLEATGVSVNVACLVAHGNVRCAVMGLEDRAPSSGELDGMRELVDEAMGQGAFGMSSGLVYPPGSYAETEELVELAKVVAPHGGFYATHMRDEGGRLVEAVTEALEIGTQGGVGVQVSHLKALGKPNWGKVDDALDLMQSARDRGVDVHCDMYPYTAGSTVLSAMVLPGWAFEGTHEDVVRRLRDPETRRRMGEDNTKRIEGMIELPKLLRWLPKRWILPIVLKKMVEIVVISSVKYDHSLEGKTLAQVVRESGKGLYDAVYDLLADEDVAVLAIAHAMTQRDVDHVLSQPEAIVGTDGIPMREGKPHPRTYGTFARVLGDYVRDRGVFGLEDAVRRMTGLAASKLGMTDRGTISVGQQADLVLFDKNTVADVATYDDPRRSPIGIPHVFVNGAWTVKDGAHTGARHGRVLRRN